MTKAELREKIRSLTLQVVGDKQKADDAAIAYDELTKFPELKDIIVSLMTHEFDSFLESIDWVAPRPTTFRINLLNGQNFILVFTPRSWVAQIEGKKYYLLNLDEEEYAALAISRILQYGPESGAEVEGDASETDSAPEVEDEVDVDVDVEA
jgi:hypothetical protein|tara:strand:+ start:1031 stop:1486 length:456 start_codon:yes stop_codon:yes gene_type:complete